MSPIRIATRRDFLTRGLGLVGVGATLPNFLIRTALAGPTATRDEPILVVLQLSGGHDGLSALVPYSNDHYIRSRKTSRIRENEVLRIDDHYGWHPNLKGFDQLLNDGALAVVQGVGYPNPNRSHFKSMDIWHGGDNSGRTRSYGWIGRYCDVAFRNNRDPKMAIAVGADKAPLAIAGRDHAGISFKQFESYRYLRGRAEQLERLHRKLDANALASSSDNEVLNFVARTSVNASTSSDEIQSLVNRNQGGVSYPRSQLASGLKSIAAMIRGGLNTRVYYVFQKGYDTHRDQRGRHDRLMSDLGDALAAFQQDLAEQGNSQRVLTMAFSEFGRRVEENASGGTDHGKAGPMFLIGPSVDPGIHGQAPELAKQHLDAGDLKHTVDFRSVYATVLEKWLKTNSTKVLDAEFPLIDCI